MKQAIAGVMPAQVGEATIMTVWPSIAATGIGRLFGRLFGIRAGAGFLTVGNMIALASIPIMLPLYFLRKFPFWVERYRLTNRRVIVERGVKGRNFSANLPEGASGVCGRAQGGVACFGISPLIHRSIQLSRAFLAVCESPSR
jgi:hypothetical protein